MNRSSFKITREISDKIVIDKPRIDPLLGDYAICALMECIFPASKVEYFSNADTVARSDDRFLVKVKSVELEGLSSSSVKSVFTVRLSVLGVMASGTDNGNVTEKHPLRIFAFKH